MFILQETHAKIQAGTWISFSTAGVCQVPTSSQACYYKKITLDAHFHQQLHHIQVHIETQWLESQNIFNNLLQTV